MIISHKNSSPKQFVLLPSGHMYTCKARALHARTCELINELKIYNYSLTFIKVIIIMAMRVNRDREWYLTNNNNSCICPQGLFTIRRGNREYPFSRSLIGCSSSGYLVISTGLQNTMDARASNHLSSRVLTR